MENIEFVIFQGGLLNNNLLTLPLAGWLHVHRKSSGPCGSNDMQMLPAVSENSTVISTNAVGKQTTGAQDISGFPIGF